jgi:hypothetical protein
MKVDNFEDILKKALSMPSVKESLKELGLTEVDLKKHFTSSDLLTIIDSQDNPEYTTTIYLNSKKEPG